MEKKKILIIDDEKDFTQLVKLNLELTGKYEVRVENKSSLALSTAKQHKPDLILLDVIMPDIAGGEVAYQLKNDTNTKDIPIIFLTAAATKEEAGRGKGEYPFVAKPASTEELIDCIEQNL